MKIAIISDIHNNEVNLKKVLDYCKEKNIKTIICCGDLASQETLDFFNENFEGEIHYTFGNMDNDQLTDIERHLEPKGALSVQGVRKYKQTFIYKKFGELAVGIGSLQSRDPIPARIAFVHYPDVARELCESGKYNFVFYGHTHKPWVASAPDFAKASTGKEAAADQGQKKCTMLNPGNVAGELYPPTFAVWHTEDDKFELIRIHDLK